MKNAKLIFLVFGIALCFLSCRKKDAIVKLPEVPSKLVIVSFVSPQDSMIRVNVSLSQPLFNNSSTGKYDALDNAKVVIKSSLGSATLQFDPESEDYLIDSTYLKIRAGYTYEIEVTTPDGKKATASTTVPSANTSLSLTFVPESGNLKVNWQDEPGVTNYYRMLVVQSSYYLFEGFNQNGSFSDTIKTRYAFSEWMLDTDNPNQVLEKRIPFGPDTSGGKGVDFYLLNVSKEYYDYSQKLNQAAVNGNPFAEAVIMYTNVNGGFGVFAGYNGYRKKIY